MKFDKLAERQILKAKAQGQLEGLKGEGKPLPKGGGDTVEDAGFRIMAEAGALPEEIQLRKAIEAKQAELARISDPVEPKRGMAELAELQMRLAIQEEARRKLMGG